MDCLIFGQMEKPEEGRVYTRLQDLICGVNFEDLSKVVQNGEAKAVEVLEGFQENLDRGFWIAGGRVW